MDRGVIVIGEKRTGNDGQLEVIAKVDTNKMRPDNSEVQTSSQDADVKNVKQILMIENKRNNSSSGKNNTEDDFDGNCSQTECVTPRRALKRLGRGATSSKR